MDVLALKTVTRFQGNNRALKDASVQPAGYRFDFVDVPVLIDGFRRMVRGLEFDVCEMALTTYLCAREHGKRFTAIPVPLVRAFHHGAMVVSTQAGIRHPKDLEGKRVGVNRGYTVTTGLWARSILQHQYGVDLSRITWVLSGDEHVAEYRPPANVVPIEPGKKMADMVASGELAAAIGVELQGEGLAALIPDAAEAAYAALQASGLYPINHVVVIKDEVLAARPDVAVAVFNAFAQAKLRYVEQLRANSIAEPTAVDASHQRVMAITGADPLPYGLAPNRAMLALTVESALEQGIIQKRPSLESLFVPSTLELVA